MKINFRLVGLWILLLYCIPEIISDEIDFELLANAQAGDVQAQYDLAHTYYQDKQYEKSFGWFSKAAENNFADAQYMVGKCFEEGIGVEKNLNQAFVWYKKSAENGSPYSQNRISIFYWEGSIVEKSYEESFNWDLKAAKQGLLVAHYNIGCQYRYGIGVKRSKSKALKWFLGAGHTGEKHSQYELGCMYKQIDEYEAFRWFKKSAEQSYAPAQAELGEMYLRGVGTFQDDRHGIFWLQKAMDQGCMEACCAMALYHKFTNPQETVRLIATAAHAGNARGQYELGKLNYEGKIIDKDNTLAIDWYKKSASQNYTDACLALASFFKEQLDFEQAVYWWQRGADLGCSHAQTLLGWYYCNEKNDYQKAFYYFEIAAQERFPGGLFSLAMLYLWGKGVKTDINKGVSLLKKACKQNCCYSQYELGKMYYEGKCVKKNRLKGFELLKEADKNGCYEARYKLAEIGDPKYKDLQKFVKPSTLTKLKIFWYKLKNKFS